jgi:hypothetical protein
MENENGSEAYRGKEKMSEKVFLDAFRRPYLIKNLDGKDLIFYWNSDHQWVSLREIKPGEHFPDNLSKEEQHVYMNIGSQESKIIYDELD